MVITVNPLSPADKPLISDAELISIIRNSPEIREITESRKHQKDKDELQQRLDVLDQLAEVGREQKAVDSEIEKLRPKLETARRVLDDLDAKNGELHQRLAMSHRRESALSTQLNQLGEGAIWDAINLLTASIDGYRAQIAATTRHLETFHYDVFDRRYYPPGRDRVVAELDATKRKIMRAPVIQKEIGSLANARISPSEINAKVADLLASLDS